MATDRTSRSRREPDPVAIVDIGSNSVRLVVYEAPRRSPTPFYNEKVLCGLGRSLETTGQLGEESVMRALAALRRFRAVAKRLGAKGLNVIATAAAREAENGADFIARAEDICGCSISVLSGRHEAKFAARGVIAGIQNVNGLAGDLGGGSLELIDIKDRRLVGGITLPLGSLRLIDLSGGDLAAARSFVDEQLDRADWLSKGTGRPFYAVGGTWRAFARLHMEQTRYPLRVMHDYRMSIDEALKFAHLLDHLSPFSPEGIDDVSSARRETVPYGALVLERLIPRVRPSELVFSAFGVREGMLYSLISKAERRRDPLLLFRVQLAPAVGPVQGLEGLGIDLGTVSQRLIEA